MTQKVRSVDSLIAIKFSPVFPERLIVAATGTVKSSGWSCARLSPYFYIVPPEDGIWEFDFLADEPTGLAIDVILPISAEGIFSMPNWVTGVKVYADGSEKSVSVDGGKKANFFEVKKIKAAPAGFHYEQEVAQYEDSWGQVGFCEGFGHIKMHKLKHRLILVVDGPDDGKIRDCVRQATVAGLIAAVAAAYATGGLALQAAIGAFLSTLTACLGANFSARIDNVSKWEEWCT